MFNCKTFLCILDRKLQFTYPYATIKDVQAKTSSTSKHEITSLIYFLLARQKNHLCKKRILLEDNFDLQFLPGYTSVYTGLSSVPGRIKQILYFFLHLWIIFALLDPDPDPATQINADPDPQPRRT
jgi:hypothetical protein